jgi:hypothetical protein
MPKPQHETIVPRRGGVDGAQTEPHPDVVVDSAIATTRTLRKLLGGTPRLAIRLTLATSPDEHLQRLEHALLAHEVLPELLVEEQNTACLKSPRRAASSLGRIVREKSTSGTSARDSSEVQPGSFRRC